MTIPEVEKIKDNHFILLFFDVLFLVLPGIAITFFFFRDLFLSLDWIKLTLLSASIVAPVVFWNALFILLIDKDIESKKESLFAALTFSLIFTGLFLYIILIISYFLKLPFNRALEIILIVELLAAAIAGTKSRGRQAAQR